MPLPEELPVPTIFIVKATSMGTDPTAMRWQYAYFYVAGRMLPTAASTLKNVVVTAMALRVVYVNISTMFTNFLI